MRKTLSDILYNGLYQVVILFLPFLTQPYLYRVMNEEAMGLNALVNSIPSLLTVVILFGMNQYGVRKIAQAPEKQRAQTFASLWLIQFVVGILVVIGFIAFVLLFSDDKFYYLLEVPFLIGYILDISWLYVGVGEIKKVVLRNSVIKLMIVSSVFLLIHSPEDLWKLLLINSVTYLANAIFWVDLPRIIGHFPRFSDFKWSSVLFQQALIILLPTLAAQLYITLDQTLVGRLSSVLQLNYYAYPQSICRAVIAIAGSVSTVLMPKMAKMQVEGENGNRVLKLLKMSLDYTLTLSVFLTLAFMVNAAKFTHWFWDDKGTTMGLNMFFGSLIIVFVSYGGVFANQYTLARGLSKKYAIPYYIGALTSLTLNILLIPHFGSIGATGVIVFTELIVLISRIILVKNELPIRNLMKGNWKVLVAGALALIAGLVFQGTTSSLFFDLVFQTILCTFIYIAFLIIFRSRVWRDFYKLIRRRR